MRFFKKWMDFGAERSHENVNRNFHPAPMYLYCTRAGSSLRGVVKCFWTSPHKFLRFESLNKRMVWLMAAANNL